tara:strand:- start:4702 stop:5088 length:387 start_codon:yes stop_codon:yes gene_type:complete
LELPVSIISAASVFRALVDSKVEATRDGFLLRDINSHTVSVGTSFWDESQLLAVLEEVCVVLRGRGATVSPKMKASVKLDKPRPTEGLRIDPLPETPKAAPKKAAVEVPAPAALKSATKAPKGRSKRG